jgi:hypothetical protein
MEELLLYLIPPLLLTAFRLPLQASPLPPCEGCLTHFAHEWPSGAQNLQSFFMLDPQTASYYLDLPSHGGSYGRHLPSDPQLVWSYHLQEGCISSCLCILRFDQRASRLVIILAFDI